MATRTWTLYVVRHGVAEERGPEWPDDNRRPLTDRGRHELKQIGQGLVRLGIVIDVLLTSPLVRAKQTADALASVLDPSPAVTVIDSLSPGAAHAALVHDLAKHARRSSIALVGHEPGIGQTAARLAGLRKALEFKKGAVCRIDLEEFPPGTPGHLRWFAPPKLLRRLH
ncbi:MAG: phosphohistidine phosphatase SixA [Vicinamibacterales bacterium]